MINLVDRIRWTDNHVLKWIVFSRPINTIVAVFGVFVCGMLTSYITGMPVDNFRLLLGLIITILLLSGIIMENDYIDLDTDRWCRPWRPLVRGTITIYKGIIVSLILIILSIILSVFMGLLCFIVVFLNAFNGLAYNHWLKKRHMLGIISVSIGVATIPLWGNLIVTTNIMILFYIWMGIFCIEIFREMSGVHCQDCTADRKAGFHTIPALLGRKQAMLLGLPFLILSAILLINQHIPGNIYLTGIVSIITIFSMCWLSCYTSLQSNDEKHIYYTYDIMFRGVTRTYLIIFQLLMLLEIFL